MESRQPSRGGQAADRSSSAPTGPLPYEARSTLLHLLQPDEKLHVETRAADARLVLTDRRVVVADEERVSLDVAYEALRRVQLDVERDRPATLVIVPHDPRHQPQVLMIPPSEYGSVAQAVALIGARLAGEE
jgi:hypothetical protein